MTKSWADVKAEASAGRRHIVSRHWTRENARRNERRLQRRLDRLATTGGRWRDQEILARAGVPEWAHSVRVERAGRIRVRWVVVAVS